MFFGESMFSVDSGGSSVALAGLARTLREWGFPLLDAQVENPHLISLGAQRMAREDFARIVAQLTALAAPPGSWTSRFGEVRAYDLVSGQP
jgi:leucyl/phenylalanyl-tRNA--protein transferase